MTTQFRLNPYFRLVFSDNMNTVLPSFTGLFKRSRRSLMYGSIAAVTIGLEGFFESIVFSCPCEGHFAYGLAFLWAPAVLLFLIGILVDRDLWSHSRRNSVTKKETKPFTRRHLKALLTIIDVLVRASIAPVAWLILSFLQQQYYTCAFFGPPLTSGFTAKNTTVKCSFKLDLRTRLQEEHYKTRSQIAGWSLMLVAMSVLFTTICIRRCVRKGKHLKIPSLDYYHHVEAKEALEHYHNEAKELAKKKAKKGIDELFKKTEANEFNSRLQNIAKEIQDTYGRFFVIPPESPTYTSPSTASKDPPEFPSHASLTVNCSLLSDGSEVKNEGEKHGLSSATNTPRLSPTCQTAYISYKGHTKPAFNRQNASSRSQKETVSEAAL